MHCFEISAIVSGGYLGPFKYNVVENSDLEDPGIRRVFKTERVATTNL